MQKHRDWHLIFNGFSIVHDHLKSTGDQQPLIMLHGAGEASKERFERLRFKLLEHGIGSVALDFIGHGDSAGSLAHSSLEKRTQQVMALIELLNLRPPFRFFATSMGAYNAIKLSQLLETELLILGVPGVYTPKAYSVPFGDAFSKIIREKESWRQSDAWEILEKYRGKLLIVASTSDAVIPPEIPAKLYRSASHAVEKELLWLEQCSHQLMRCLNKDEQVMEEIVSKIALRFY
jgi:pimeloyl-ACP methyl ester carboxylesterase